MSGRFNVRSDFSVISMHHSVFGLRLGGMGAVFYFLNLICPSASQARSEPWFCVGSRKGLGLLFSVPFSPLSDFPTREFFGSFPVPADLLLRFFWKAVGFILIRISNRTKRI